MFLTFPENGGEKGVQGARDKPREGLHFQEGDPTKRRKFATDEVSRRGVRIAKPGFLNANHRITEWFRL